MVSWLKKVFILQAGVRQAIREDVVHEIRNATPTIYQIAKRAKMDGRLTDQEYALINVNLAKIEGCISYVHLMNTGKSWLQKKFM